MHGTTVEASVLIVDDDAAAREYLAAQVTTLGSRVIEAADGRAALDIVSAFAPDLVLLDVEMPRMDGWECCRRLKYDSRTRLIPVIMVTSLSTLDDRIRGIEAGADDFLVKPVRVPELLARMRSLLRVKRLNETLESAENVIFAMARAIEAKDAYTDGHTERVTAFAVELGKALGCPPEDITGLRQGAVLHDVGKIGVPDAILNKPGRLTTEEFDFVKRHPLIGYNICLPLRSLAHALPCIRSHHEKPNGRGYPDGLAGEEVPRLARILAVADVFDALSTRRPYKDAFPREKAYAILREEAETGGLDAMFVSTFIDRGIPDIIQETTP